MTAMYDAVSYSRLLTEITLGFHIIFATIGVGVPVMIALAEWRGIKRNDPYYILLARRWTRGFVITVAIGVVTGTSIGLQLSLLWPSFMQVAGQAIGLPLFMETFAFFVEAIFLGIYLYTWDRFKNPFVHFMLIIPIALAASASAFFITCVNAFMNTPQGFTLENGVIRNVEPIKAMFNPATATKVSHVLSSAYMTCAFVLAAIAAFSLIKGRSDKVYARKALKLTLVAGIIFGITNALIGDFSGKFLAAYQPVKLAAAEWHFETKDKAELIMGGFLTEDNEIKYALKIPYALSILAGGSPNTVVHGLNETPPELQPPLRIHYYFDGMVLIGTLTIAIGVVYLWFSRAKRKKPLPRWLLIAIVCCGPLSVIAIELGWIYAEVGRLPWILVGYMKVEDGATTANNVHIMLLLFCLLYLVLAISCIKVLAKLFRNAHVADELLSLGIEGGKRK
ncbi:cytochrome ubiquinol oxidase subunit I [Paenibacillus albiflavus]|uniref:Cytochrome ubiquinol oxidase subunit I n=1 Tax=Paenibacillus albiflavus TaxID=2545760 RepID=A0A4R4EDU3_9BACL|nr:cytochrome ubiquinol oxidase subunit I [Paenibacillus albiflavus]TCZ77220.1 cytochrome ubiquinol oxidase subunit I [Paenibacillus albiflavus]